MLKVATKFPPQASAFEAAHAAGFGFAEFWLDANWLEQWQDVARLAVRYPLGYALHFPNRGQLSDTTLEQSTHLYRKLNCSAMVIHAPMLQRYQSQLLSHDPDLRLGVENHRLSEVEFDRWAVENTWLTLDVEHLWKYTLGDVPVDQLIDSVRRFLERFSEKLVHVHLPGYFPSCASHRPMYCSRDMVFAVLSLLADCGFDGLIVSEADAPFQNPHELRMDVLLYERWLELRQDEGV